MDEINSEHPSFYSKKKQSADQCELEENSKGDVYILPKSGPVVPDVDSVVPVISIMEQAPGLARKYKNLQKNEKATKQAATLIKKLANGSMKIGSKNIRKIQGMKKIYEAQSKDVRVYFRMKGETVEIIGPCLKTDQTDSIKLLKKYFK